MSSNNFDSWAAPAPNPFALAADQLEGPKSEFERYQTDPGGFFRDILGLPVWPDPYPDNPRRPYMWEHQLRIPLSVVKERRTSVRSPHSVGKDFTVARVAIWFLHSFRDSVVITTGPTDRQVKYILWSYIRKAAGGATVRLPGRLLDQEWKVGEGWYALGFKSRDADAERFSGFHSEHILYIVDEASGVSEPIYEGIQGGMASGDARLLLIGNPTQPSGTFFQSHNDSAGEYNPIHIKPDDTPNFDPKVLKAWAKDGKPRNWPRWPAPYLLNPAAFEEMRRIWGEDSTAFRVRALGEFPLEGSNNLYPLHLILAAQQRLEGEDVPKPTHKLPIEIGVDPAYFGDDETVWVARAGARHLGGESWSKRDTTFSGNRVAEAATKLGARVIRVDATGIGAGVADRLVQLQVENRLDSQIRIVRVMFAAKPQNPEKYRILRDEIYDGFRQRLVDEDVTDLPDDKVLLGELTSIRYSYNARGQLEVEEKDELKKRGHKSPDRTEAMLLAYIGDGMLPGNVFDEAVGVSELTPNIVNRRF